MSGDDFELYGTRERAPISRTLTVGQLSVTFEDGNLRMLRYAGHEVLRGIAFLVRDKDWGTCTAAIRDLIIDEQPDGFSIRYHARFSAPDGANLDCAITISGGESHLSYSADYMSDADFETARAGFAVLHPIAGTAGQPVEVRHTDGSVEQANWPDAIEPWQPFKEIAAITHGVTPGIRATTAFSGDVFEMEDQRNWTDGSYKTYVRPLELPWPYRIGAGELFSQSVTVTIAAEPPAAPALVASGAVAISSSPTEFRLAEIGVGLRPDCLDEERAAIEVLEKVGARHLIAHFDPGAGHELEVLQGYAEIAARSGLRVTLETAVACTRPLEDELSEIAALVALAGLPLDTLFVCPSVDRQSTPPGSCWPDCPPLADVYAAARAAFPGIRLGGGMMSYFTELNRKRVPADLVDYISHATNPIVHAADDLSVMQSFEALTDVVASVRALYGSKPYRIGPSTIAMRQNPYGSATKDNPGLSRIRWPMSIHATMAGSVRRGRWLMPQPWRRLVLKC